MISSLKVSLLLLISVPVLAQNSTDSIFVHFVPSVPYLTSGQTNTIFQLHPPFHSPYVGANSLKPVFEQAESQISSNYSGLRVNNWLEFLLTTEEATGTGINDTVGIAGFPNLDAIRDPTASKVPYFGRIQVHFMLGLSSNMIMANRGPETVFATMAEKRLEFHVGKFSLVDFFDSNSAGSNPHFQFMNWSTAQNGSYDYAADIRGYTWGTDIEFMHPKFVFRAAEMLMPTTANGSVIEWNVRKAHSENLEFELHDGVWLKHDGTLRFLSYINHANMGIYDVAVANYHSGITTSPIISQHSVQLTEKYGFGINLEQQMSKNIEAFARWGWSNGQTESFCFTEIDSTVTAGITIAGTKWKKPYDRLGFGFASNALSKSHQNYLKDGGIGFLLGDGNLNYAREQVLESYYTYHLLPGVYIGPDIQFIQNPGMNKDRGPIYVPGFRVHIEL